MLRTVNRVLVALAGLLLVALGAAVLIGALDLRRRRHLSLPSAWPFQGPHDVLLSDADRRTWRTEGWWWPVVLAALGLAVLLSLWWLLAQLRRRRLREVTVDCGDGEVAVVRGAALEEVIAAEAESLDGVEHATVALTGRRTAPSVRVSLTLGPRAAPSEALSSLTDGVLASATGSAGLPRLPVRVRLSALRHRAERVG
ncbi:alkaline shock response membrane anchor protein AmaP [Streptomyces sp. UNOC14_S4]|uniref:alkaline shock response membrane anchor protein AmaP n=1 Tax=Streptomyces sp. UNOC14_S4 TaxID=2872340 RepID=UPI001E4AA7CC|nr:alkaline shock response membrane anchor protein AmaP [Streptomyces sp. UNOC14_S4]MCC3768495.1 alkaline shock response membrane anchor protein AmaP [Streptomyces sp. UNOC14_S4]